MSDKILSEVSAIMGGRPATEITRDIVGQYWPGSLTWEEIVSRVRSWSDGPITRDEAYEVMHVAGMLGVFGFPGSSQFREEKRVSARDTQFAGFAEAVAKELLIWDLHTAEGLQEFKRVLARRAYDLACHVIDESVGGTATELVKCIPDLTELPEEPR